MSDLNHEALRLIRVYHDLSQTDLADRLEISKSHLSGIESGAKKLTLAVLEKYSEVFQIPMSSLLLIIELSDDKQKRRTMKRHVSEKALKVLAWVADVVEADRKRS